MEDDKSADNFLNNLKALGEQPKIEGVEDAPPPTSEEIKEHIVKRMTEIGDLSSARAMAVLDPVSFTAKLTFLTAYIIAEKYGIDGLKDYMVSSGVSDLIKKGKI